MDLNDLQYPGSGFIEVGTPKNLEDLQQVLSDETKKGRSLNLFLQLMDVTIQSEKVLEKITKVLDRYLQDDQVYSFLEGKAYSVVPGPTLDPVKALQCSKYGVSERFLKFFQEFNTSQNFIQPFILAWDRSAVKHAPDTETINTVFQNLLEKGNIKSMILSLAQRDGKSWDDAMVSSILILKEHKYAWRNLFFRELKIEISKLADTDFIYYEVQSDSDELSGIAGSFDPIEKMILDYIDSQVTAQKDKKSKKRTKWYRPWKGVRWKVWDIGRPADEVLDSLDYFYDQINDLPINANWKSYEVIIIQLLAYQFENSSPDQICMSLSKISKVCLDREEIIHAKKIIGYAKLLNVDDPVVDKQFAEILKSAGDLLGSKKEYERIRAEYPQDVIAHTGYAEVLKSMGDLNGAKKEYERIRTEYPDNLITQNGYAGVLKSLGDLIGAKEEYERIRTEYPEDVFAQTGYAEVLKSLGDLNGAKKEYERIRVQFPGNITCQNGYAEVLKSMGDLNGAREEYERIRADFPNNIIAQNGYGELLKSMGDLDAAQEIYEATITANPYNEIAKNALATIYLLKGDIKKAESFVPENDNPISENDYYWRFVKISALIYSGETETARVIASDCFNSCPFYNLKKGFKRYRNYIRILEKEYSTLVSEAMEEDDSPVDHLMQVHGNAAIDRIDVARKHLEVCKQFKQVKNVYESSCLLSERYDLNGLPRNNQNLSQEELDKKILAAELEAVISAGL